MAQTARGGVLLGAVLLQSIEADNATVTTAELLGEIPDLILNILPEIPFDAYGNGVAKRAPGDPRDFDKGLLLSSTRALRQLADRLEELADV